MFQSRGGFAAVDMGLLLAQDFLTESTHANMLHASDELVFFKGSGVTTAMKDKSDFGTVFKAHS